MNAMVSNLYDAVSEGSLQRVREMVDLFGPSCEKKWSEGYDLLLISLRKYHSSNYREIAKLLLLNDSEVNSNVPLCSITPLHYAAMSSDVEIIEMLLDRGAKIDAEDAYGRTPLYHAIEKNHTETVKLLLNRGACVNVKDQDEITPLHLASKRNCSEIVVILLNCGASVNVTCYLTSMEYIRKGYTPLHYAVEQGNLEIVMLLLKNDADVDIEALPGTPLHIATMKGYQHIIEELLTFGANVNSVCSSTGWRALHVTSARGNAEAVRLLLIKGADINAVGNDNLTPLHVATKEKQGTIVKLLLDHGADINTPNKDGKTVLYVAVKTGFSVIIEDILKFSPDVSNEGHRSALKFAISHAERCKETIQKLLEYGFAVNSTDICDCDLLHGAVRTGNLKIVKKLLQYGTDVNFKPASSGGLTLLHVATFYSQEEMAKLLIDHGADVNVKDSIQKSPLFYAVQTCNWTITELLLSNGADMILHPNIVYKTEFAKNIEQYFSVTDINGNGGLREINRMLLRKAHYNIPEGTALHVAACRGHGEFVNMLLQYGDEVDCRDENNWTPLHVAARMSHQGIIERLLNFGANIDSKDTNGMTALHFASKEKQMFIVETLLESGADINIISNCNFTALDYVFSDSCHCYRNQLHSSYSEHVLPSVQFPQPWGCDVLTAEVLIRHLVKMKAENLFVSRRYLRRINTNLKLKRYYGSCEIEITQMRNEKIGNTDISFYDILTKGALQLAAYARNESIVESLKSTGYITMFPIYWHTILSQFKKGQERNRLSNGSVQSFQALSGYELPHLPTNQIFSCLSNLDLKNLMAACPDASDDEGYSLVLCKWKHFKL